MLDATAGDMADAAGRRAVSAAALIEASLARCHAAQETLNCFVLILGDEARRRAEAADRAIAGGATPGPLHGVPVAIKDMTPTAGHLTTLGSWTTGDTVPARSALIVERLEAAGAIVVAKTTTPEFAHSGFTYSDRWGVTRNPWDPARSPGGSSGGSGAAVAAGCVPLAEGTDMGGSVRIPASFCGVVGLKPSLGRIPMTILPTVFDTLSHFGPLARTVDDAIRFMAVTAGPSEEDIQSLPLVFDAAPARSCGVQGRRFALSLDLGFYAIHPEVERAVRAAAAKLATRGAVVEEVHLPWRREVVDRWGDLWGVFMSGLFGSLVEAAPDRVDPLVRSLIARGHALTATQLKRIELLRTAMWRDMAKLFARFDALLCPTCARTAPLATESDSDYEGDLPDGRFAGLDLTAPFNMVSACPAVSVPIGLAPDGLPVGLQIVGRRHADEDVLSFALAVERDYPPLRCRRGRGSVRDAADPADILRPAEPPGGLRGLN